VPVLARLGGGAPLDRRVALPRRGARAERSGERLIEGELLLELRGSRRAGLGEPAPAGSGGRLAAGLDRGDGSALPRPLAAHQHAEDEGEPEDHERGRGERHTLPGPEPALAALTPARRHGLAPPAPTCS